MKKLTKKQQAERAAYEQEEAKLQAWEVWRDANHARVQKGRVIWFDRLRGEGWVRADDGHSYTIYACNLPGKRTWFPETACTYYDEGQEIEFKLDITYGSTFVIGLTPANFDSEKYTQLNPEKLAFRCDEGGQLVSGLFA
jgi:hypothetical protein